VGYQEVIDHVGLLGFMFNNVSVENFLVWLMEGGVGFLEEEDIPAVETNEETFDEYLDYLEKLGFTFNNVSDDDFWVWFREGGVQFLQKGMTDRYNKHGISSTIEPQNKEKLTAEVKKRRRPLSMKLEKGEKLQEALDEEAKRPRTFIRTWVRLVPLSSRISHY
jgi:hypothetical protein